MMNVGRQLAVVCLEALPHADERRALEHPLRDTGKQVLALNFDQLENFAGNMLEVHDRDGARCW
jgi:hypothetical protein